MLREEGARAGPSDSRLLPKCTPRVWLERKQNPKPLMQGLLGSSTLCRHTLRAGCPQSTGLPSPAGGQRLWALGSGVSPGAEPWEGPSRTSCPPRPLPTQGVSFLAPTPPHPARLRRGRALGSPVFPGPQSAGAEPQGTGNSQPAQPARPPHPQLSRATGAAGNGVAQLRELLPPGEMAERGPRFLQAKEGDSQCPTPGTARAPKVGPHQARAGPPVAAGLTPKDSRNPGSPVNHSSASAGSPPTQAPSVSGCSQRCPAQVPRTRRFCHPGTPVGAWAPSPVPAESPPPPPPLTSLTLQTQSSF